MRLATALTILGVMLALPSPADAAAAPKVGASCKKAQLGLAAANGLVCVKERTRYRWRKPASPTASPGAVLPAPTPAPTPAATPTPSASPAPAAGASVGPIGKRVWFSDQEIELVTLTMAERDVVLETRITNRGLFDGRTLKVLNDMPVVIDSPSGSVRLGTPSSMSSVAIGAAIPGSFRGIAPAGFSLTGATIRLGDSGANAVTIPIAGEAAGSKAALIDAVSGAGPITFTSNTRTSQTDVKVTHSLLRPQIRPGTKGRYDLQLELTITVGAANSGGANVDPALFAFNGLGTSCCTDLTSLIYTLGPGRTVTGWINFSLSEWPGPSMTLSIIKDGTGSIPLTFVGV